ncbi:DUF441 domain-containing protein [Caldalkalibacillus mannanilyticus]|uniref:DUF441 domain-containing protein n=1 Tax=Caldalkalibacillus mannanilyticus TaxID=1418 RepID=UPI000469E122|nr:DUF441 domain-containing protein [Caldalkalibacillus mannanilyticus]
MSGEILLVLLIIIGLMGNSPIISTAASLLLIFKLTSLDRFFPTIERRGLEIGLLFLTIAVLIPFATDQIKWKDIQHLFTSWYGIVGLTGGALATYLNQKGLLLLRVEPEMIIGLVIGSIAGIIFLHGLPVGPLMAAGITAMFVQFFGRRNNEKKE